MQTDLITMEAQESADKAAPDAPTGIPPETWAALQSAGHVAAERLRELLQSSGFPRMKPTDQARLIELALNRAYGPPIKREMSLTLSGNVSDAVAESLGRLAGQALPEMGGTPARKGQTPDST